MREHRQQAIDATDHGLQRGPPQQHDHVVHRLWRRIRSPTVRRNRAGHGREQDAKVRMTEPLTLDQTGSGTVSTRAYVLIWHVGR
jgi:hypothetical protein